MCGFLGIYSSDCDNIQSKFRLSRSIKSIQARGGDKDEYFEDQSSYIYHSRLCIQGDLETGRQPYLFDAYVMVFNGNITNYKSLAVSNRLKCSRKKTFSDTDVIAELFQKYGDNCFEYLNGFYSICIYDTVKKSFILASDRTGQKPLYWSLSDDTLIFSSTLEIFYENNFKTENTSIIDYLAYGFIPKPKTIFSSVKSILPGTVIKIEFTESGTKWREWQHWDVDFTNIGSKRTDMRDFGDLLTEVVRDNMVANQHVATLFSGGVDSSLIAFNVAQQKKESNLLTLSFPGDDTLERTSMILKELSAVKHSIFTPDVGSNEKILANLANIADSPFEDTSIIPTYQIFEFGKKLGFNVFLTGDGADELFLGYNYFERFQKFCNIQRFLPQKILYLAFKSYAFLKMNDKHNSFYSSSSPNELLPKIFETGFDLQLFRDEFKNGYDPTIHLSKMADKGSGLSDFEMLRYLSLKFKLPNQMLYKVDRASGANACEARPIFLDNRIIDYSLGHHHNHHLKNGTKSVLKDLYIKYYNNSAHKIPKTGFGIKSENYSWILDENSINTLNDNYNFDVAEVLASRAKNGKKGFFSLRSLAAITNKMTEIS